MELIEDATPDEVPAIPAEPIAETETTATPDAVQENPPDPSKSAGLTDPLHVAEEEAAALPSNTELASATPEAVPEIPPLA